MKRQYNTLNEEVNRIKSLFGESRLYGNLVDNQEEIILEQRRFFQSLKKGFSLVGKGFADLGKYTDFLAREIRTADDIVKHLDDFPDIWKSILKNRYDIPRLKKSLGMLNDVEDLKRLKQDQLSSLMAVFPEEGGMRDMVLDIWKDANGLNSNLPVVKGEVRVVVKDVTTGLPVVHSKNVNGDIVTYNHKGEVIDYQGNVVDDFSNVKQPHPEEGTIIFDKNGDEIGTIDAEGNIRDAKGDIVKKADRNIEDAVVVDNDLNVKSSEEVDAILEKSIKDSDSGGIYLTKEDINNREAAQYQKDVLQHEKDVMQHEKEMANTKTDSEKIELEKMKVELELKKVELDKTKAELDGKGIDSGGNPTGEILTDDPGLKDIEEEISEELSEELGVSKDSSWWKKNIDPLFEKIFVFKTTEGDSKLLKNTKFFGSAMVDPFGIFKKYDPNSAQLAAMSKGRLMFWRAVKGNFVNLLTWNVVMYQIPGLWGGENDSFSLTNIWGTKFRFYRDYAPLTAVFGYMGRMEKKSFCKKLKEKSGICCEKSAGCPGYSEKFIGLIPEMIEKKFGGGKYSCSQLRELLPDGQHMSPEKRKQVSGEIAEKYNTELMEKLDLGWGVKGLQLVGYLNTELSDISNDVLANAEDDEGNNLLDMHLQGLAAKECAKELKVKKLPKTPDGEVFVEGGEADLNE